MVFPGTTTSSVTSAALGPFCCLLRAAHPSRSQVAGLAVVRPLLHKSNLVTIFECRLPHYLCYCRLFHHHGQIAIAATKVGNFPIGLDSVTSGCMESDPLRSDLSFAQSHPPVIRLLSASPIHVLSSVIAGAVAGPGLCTLF
jgi:hypothetical protein